MEIKLDHYARVSAALRELGERADASDAEEQMLKIAAKALFFALTQHLQEFNHFLDDLDRPLTDEQRSYLKALGLEDKP